MNVHIGRAAGSGHTRGNFNITMGHYAGKSARYMDKNVFIGRYSGQLVVNFDRYDDGKRQSLVFNCKKFEPFKKKF